MRIALKRVVGVLSCVVWAAAPLAVANTTIVDDRSAFSVIPHVLIDFETDANGDPVDVPAASAIVFPMDHYAEVGFIFAGRDVISWQDVPPPCHCEPVVPAGIRDAVEIAGSRPTVITGRFDPWELVFTKPVRTVGIALVQNGWTNTPSEAIAPTILAYDDEGNLLAKAALWGDLVDGGFGDVDGYFRVPYGFVGFQSDVNIARLEFVNTGFTLLDDLHFSAVPAPGAVVVMGVGVAGLVKRRR